MKTSVQNQSKSGLTLVEVLVVIAVLAILAAFLLSTLPPVSGRENRITCVNNLKQVALAFRIYAGDNRNHYPTDLSTNDQPVVNELTPVYQYFQSLSNEIGTVKVVICPADEKRKVAQNFSTLRDVNISYFVGLDANENLPTSILLGDRNLKNGVEPDHGILRLTTNQMVEFTEEIHSRQGNIAIGDGSVQRVSSARLRSEIIRNLPLATNRIKLP
ncbi:MAG: type II secretion system protein [Verrucomicrobiota bacterium]